MELIGVEFLNFSDKIIFLFARENMSDDDYCVYARNILGRLNSVSIPSTSFNSETTPSTSPTDTSGINVGIMIIMLLVAIFILLTIKSKGQKSKKSIDGDKIEN